MGRCLDVGLAASNGQKSHHIPMLVKKHSVDEGGVDGRVGRMEITSDRGKGAVVEAVPLTQGEVEKEGPGVVEELEGARAVLLEAFLPP